MWAAHFCVPCHFMATAVVTFRGHFFLLVQDRRVACVRLRCRSACTTTKGKSGPHSKSFLSFFYVLCTGWCPAFLNDEIPKCAPATVAGWLPRGIIMNLQPTEFSQKVTQWVTLTLKQVSKGQHNTCPGGGGHCR